MNNTLFFICPNVSSTVSFFQKNYLIKSFWEYTPKRLLPSFFPEVYVSAFWIHCIDSRKKTNICHYTAFVSWPNRFLSSEYFRHGKYRKLFCIKTFCFSDYYTLKVVFKNGWFLLVPEIFVFLMGLLVFF